MRDGAPCLVFLTSSTHTGNLGGLSGADAICQGLAAAEQLSGTYKAWLSDDTASPDTRFANTEHTGPYVLVDGTQIATDWEDLTDETIAAPIDLTEGEVRVVGAIYVWTNTRGDGTAVTTHDPVGHCTNWSIEDVAGRGIVGVSNQTTFGGWSRGASHHCSAPVRLYCFQQG